ncbi:2-keto-3-deoxy-L-rhamnonate aldolase-like, partial [Phoenix dactylifera]|uniref:2-keto-3-deoxy-L-rhamnonate aldolase-like n=1 Tax=Phoenix dactylifera TaxID=42345 RepID=A0A8B8ZGZ9_PHODC
MEHGSGGIAEALPCLLALAAARTPAILRLPELSAAWAKKALDLGPQGLMFPMIESPGAAELAVSFCRFPPRGVHGSVHTVVRASAYGINDGYLARVDEETSPPPWPEAILLGFQHYLVMLGTTV